jgi:hypothetical protein
VAQITSRHTFANRGKEAHEALYLFPLPADAAVVGLEVKVGGKTARAVVVDATAAVTPMDDPEGAGGAPDLALLRKLSTTSTHAVYELRVWPVAGSGEVTASIDWLAPLRYDGGRLSLRVPSRGGAADLSVPRVALSVAPPAGARTLDEVAAQGKVLAHDIKSRASYRFAAPADDDLIVEVVPRFAGSARPVVTASRRELADGHGLPAVSVLVPPPTPAEVPQYDRAVFFVDVSRSLGDAGNKAARTLVGAVLGSLPADTRIEGVLFDRKAQRVWNDWGKNDRDGRKKLDQAIAAAPRDNGSDLGAALDLARPILRHRTAEEKQLAKEGDFQPRTLVVFVSDGLAPLALTGDRAVDRYGGDLLDEAFVVSLTLFPEGTTAPASDEPAVGALALRAGGRSIVVRDRDAAEAGKRLSAELAQPAPLRAMSLGAGAGVLDGLDLPGELQPGQGAVAVGRSVGTLPRELVLSGRIGGDGVELPVRAAGPSLSRALLPLYLAQAGPDGFVSLAERESDGDYDSPREKEVWLKATRDYARAAQTAGLVTPYTALVALMPGDGLSADRLAFVKKWGPSRFERLLPPHERFPGLAPEVVPPPSRVAAVAVTPRAYAPTGELDEAIVRRLMQTFVVPRARQCYQLALREDPRAIGSIDLVVEMSRGEVSHAYITASTFRSAAVDLCVIDAAYQIQVPRVGVGDAREAVVVARYPMSFKLSEQGVQVSDEKRAPVAPADPKKGGTPLSPDAPGAKDPQ